MKKACLPCGMFIFMIIFALVLLVSPLAAEVNSDGSFGYSVPIEVPPGTNGMQPGLSLEYNSNSSNGIAGVGWDLKGLPYIARDPRFSINYKGYDEYHGPHGRLVRVTDGSYHYEEETFSRFQVTMSFIRDEMRCWQLKQINGSLTGDCGLIPVYEPLSWIETKPDGTKYYYGSTESSRIMAASHEGQVRLWALSKVEDIYGNYYTVEYEQEDGEYYPVKIVYTFNDAGSIKKYRKIELEYEDRDDTSVHYRSSTYVKTGKRLKNIRTYIQVRDFIIFETGTLVKRYELVYSTSGTSKKSLLQEVRTYGSDDETYQTVRFDWNREEQGWSANIPELEPPVLLGDEKGDDKGVRFIDMNGDGRKDCVQYLRMADGTEQKGTWLNMGSYWYKSDKVPPVPIAIEEIADSGTRFVDLNGDGNVDCIQFRKKKDGSVEKGAWLNAGSGWVSAPAYSEPLKLPISDNALNPSRVLSKPFPEKMSNFLPYSIIDDAGARFADLNGDGLMDYVVHRKREDGTVQKGAWINTGSGWNFDIAYCTPEPISVDGRKYNGTQLIDLNGDGRADFFYHRKMNGQAVESGALLNGIDSITIGDKWGPAESYIPPYHLSCYSTHTKYISHYSDGDQSFKTYYTHHDYDTGVVFNDLNNDNLPDMVWNFQLIDGTVESGSALNTGTGWIVDANFLPQQVLSYQMLLEQHYLHTIGMGMGCEDRYHDYSYLYFSKTAGSNFIDINNDGLPDMLYAWDINNDIFASNTNVNTGSAFSPVSSNEYLPPYTQALDIDITATSRHEDFGVRYERRNWPAEDKYSEVYSRNNGIKNRETIITNVTYVDLDGDGSKDVLWHYKTNSGEIKKGARLNRITSKEVITGVHDSIGGSIAIDYRPALKCGRAIRFENNTYPVVADTSDRNVVMKVSLSDGRGNSSSSSYEYVNGKYFQGKKHKEKSLFFEMVRETDDQSHKQTVSYFKQDNPLFSGCLLRKEVYVEVPIARWPWKWPFLAEKTEYAYYDDDTGMATDFIIDGTQKPTKRGRIKSIHTTTYENGVLVYEKDETFTYDAYGNIKKTISMPSDSPALIRDYDYSYDTTRWIVNRKTEEKVTSNDKVLRWNRYEFIGNALHAYAYLDTENRWLSSISELDIHGNVQVATDARSNKTQTIYDPDYYTFPVEVINPLGHRITRQFNEATGSIQSETDGNNNSTEWLFDCYNRIRKEIGPGGVWVKKVIYHDTVDAHLRYVETRFKDASAQGYYYSREYLDGLNRKYRTIQKAYMQGENNLVSVTDISFGPNGKVTAQTKPYLARVSGTPDQYSYIKLEDTGTTAYTYDSLGRIRRITYPDTSWEKIDYASSTEGLTETHTGSDGKTSSTLYDSKGNIVRKSEPEDVVMCYQYSPLGELTLVTNPYGHVTRIKYDSLGRKTVLKDPNTGRTQYHYDDSGNVDLQVDANGNQITSHYDKCNRIKVAIYHDGESGDSTTRYQYDDPTVLNGIGRLTSVEKEYTTAAGGTEIIRADYAYDKRGNVKLESHTIDGRTYIIRRKYNSQDKMISLTYPDGVEVNYDYADNGYLHEVSWNGAPVVRYGRFYVNEQGVINRSVNVDAGLQSSASVPAGTSNQGETNNFSFYRITGDDVETRVFYDPLLSRPKHILTTFKNNTETITHEDVWYDYDQSGNIKLMRDGLDGSMSQTFEYDGLNRLKKAVGSYGTQLFEYDKAGNLVNKALSSTLIGNLEAGIDIRYSVINRPATSMRLYYKDPKHPAAVTEDSQGNSYRYDANGSMIEYQGKSLRYDGMGCLIAIDDDRGRVESYLYDFMGSRIKKQCKDGTTVYSIGGLYELNLVPGREPHYTKYFYGINGELVAQHTETNSTLVTFAMPQVLDSYFNTANFNGFALYAYGYLNHFSRDMRSYRYLGQAFIIALVLGMIGIYVLLFLRKEKTALPQWHVKISPALLFTFFLVFGFAGCDVPFSPGGAKPWDTEELPDSFPEKNMPAAGMYFFHPDYTGNISYITNAAGKKICQLWYSPFGEIIKQVGSDIFRYTYGSHEYDGVTGLMYYGARYYAPMLGRFISADDIIPNPENSQSYNRYSYVEGKVINYTDRYGNEGDELWDSYWDNFYKSLEEQYESIKESINNRIDGIKYDDILQGGLNTANIFFELAHDYGIMKNNPAASVFYTGLGLLVLDIVFSMPKDLSGRSILEVAIWAAIPNGGGFIDDLFKSATSIGKGGVSPVGRALQKHASREGSYYTGATGNATKNTLIGSQYLREIMQNGTVKRTIHPVEGEIIRVRLPNGAGAWWKADGTFKGFLEPYTPK